MFKNLIQFWKGKDFLSEVLQDFKVMLDDSEKMFMASYDVLIENKKMLRLKNILLRLTRE